MTITMSPQGAGDGGGPMSDLAHQAFRGLAAYVNETSDKYGDSKCAKEYPQVDYTVLSVAVMTLSLLLIVEIALHKLDHLAEGHRFTQAVLTSLYRERKFICLASIDCIHFGPHSFLIHLPLFQHAISNFHSQLLFWEL
jgi:hypothetical protein